jgi:hypothetical protein
MSPGQPPPEATAAQVAFWKGMTDQRVANMWDAADFIADLSPEAREFLLKADKEKIGDLDRHITFFNNAKVIWKFLWVGVATLFGIFVGITQIWDWVAKHLPQPR